MDRSGINMYCRSFQIDACRYTDTERSYTRCADAWDRRFGYDKYWFAAEIKRCRMYIKCDLPTYKSFQTAAEKLDPDMKYLKGIPVELEEDRKNH